MPEKKEKNFQTNQYDKLLKENLEQTLPMIIKDVLHLDIIDSEEIRDDIQHTKERKPDALKKVTDNEGSTFILHLEFQVQDELKMAFRMLEYCVMLMRKYELDVKQYVIFLKDSIPSMSKHIKRPYLNYHYSLIRLSDVDYRLFLRSKNPEVQMLGVLANLGVENREHAVQSIVNEIDTGTKNELIKEKYFKQLRIFVQLRTHIEQPLNKAMQSVSTFFKEEKDFLYRKGKQLGEENGLEKKARAVVENLFTKLGCSDEKAAEIAEVSLEFVQQIRAELSKKK